MRPFSWHMLHVASFLGALVALGATLASVGGVLPENWRAISLALLVMAAVVHYVSDPRRPWVMPH